ncbi:AP-3 complex subunit sigma-2-like [Sycon ciliatum]|uniref:AP-3 complex subunit sigma-2-like n=1 Tax=Sycon ciliatum TaxID=27933 RepID=UPI0020ADCD61|eukprot:scpid90251/ scgid28094/ AP-3 complex subunit sigma-2; AP-3 complex subunit sigma-3B; Adapter-related protein complex 3 sigma-2 subunit; Sigma-3B-adaptin; Sigma-adaptin 3b
MIKAVLVFNNHGKARLMKFFHYFTEDQQQQAVREVFQIISKRADSECNFVEGISTELLGGMDYSLVYRHYATLYFVFCCDSSESELGILDLIQVLVESLDKCFENVCELDLIFHVDKVHYLVNEIVMGGMVLETNMAEIIPHAQHQLKIEKEDKGTAQVVVAGVASAPTRAVAAVNQVKLAVQQGLK